MLFISRESLLLRCMTRATTCHTYPSVALGLRLRVVAWSLSPDRTCLTTSACVFVGSRIHCTPNTAGSASSSSNCQTSVTASPSNRIQQSHPTSLEPTVYSRTKQRGLTIAGIAGRALLERSITRGSGHQDTVWNNIRLGSERSAHHDDRRGVQVAQLQ